MIIKATRGNDFVGVVDYVARLGAYMQSGPARILALSDLYDLRTAAAQLAYDAALDPSRTRPVVHLIARAEQGLDDDQYLALGQRMLTAAGLEGHRFLAAVHDDDGHLHVVVCEVNQDGAVPARFLWSKEEKRKVSVQEAEQMLPGTVEGRAWDSHLAWRLTHVARKVEVEWGLRRLSSSARANDHNEPRREQWQKERLAQTGKVPLQDRYWDEVRTALALPTWDDRATALARHGLAVRAHEVAGRVRGLQVQNLVDAMDFVKISAFELGGMPKLDASADQPFLEWAAQERQQRINLTKAITSKNPDMLAAQAAFKLHQKEWRRRERVRVAAHQQRRRDSGIIDADVKEFADRYRPVMTEMGFRRARAAKRRGLKVIADTRLAEALSSAGPVTAKPVFVDFVKARAGTGDAVAARVHLDVISGVSETRRRSLDRVAAMANDLANAVQALRDRRNSIIVEIAAGREAMQVSADALARRARAQVADMAATVGEMAIRGRIRFAKLAAQLARQVYDAGHRIRMQYGTARVDNWRPSMIEEDIMASSAGCREFETYGKMQSEEVQDLRESIVRTGSTRQVNNTVEFDVDRSDIGNPMVLRWAAEPEIIDTLHEVDRTRRIAADRLEQAETERRTRKEAADQQSRENEQVRRRDAANEQVLQHLNAVTDLGSTPNWPAIEHPSDETLSDGTRAAAYDALRLRDDWTLIDEQQYFTVSDDALVAVGLSRIDIATPATQDVLEAIMQGQVTRLDPVLVDFSKQPRFWLNDGAMVLDDRFAQELRDNVDRWGKEPQFQAFVAKIWPNQKLEEYPHSASSISNSQAANKPQNTAKDQDPWMQAMVIRQTAMVEWDRIERLDNVVMTRPGRALDRPGKIHLSQKKLNLVQTNKPVRFNPGMLIERGIIGR